MANYTKYEIGKPFPHERPYGIGPDTPRLQTTSAFLDFILYSADAKRDEKQWMKGPCKPYLYLNNDLIYVVVDFLPEGKSDRFTLDCPFNFRKVIPVNQSEWLASQTNALNLFLVDYSTNKLHGIRLISVDWAAELRAACTRQMNRYATMVDVDVAGQQLERSIDTLTMVFNRWKP